jgi:hypothetical protein
MSAAELAVYNYGQMVAQLNKPYVAPDMVVWPSMPPDQREDLEKCRRRLGEKGAAYWLARGMNDHWKHTRRNEPTL